jgi:hypothetical protein
VRKVAHLLARPLNSIKSTFASVDNPGGRMPMIGVSPSLVDWSTIRQPDSQLQ